MKKLTREEFIEKARLIHGDKYDYSKVVYANNSTKICIICPIHGEFWQTPGVHLKGSGCKLCSFKTKIKDEKVRELEFIKKANNIHGSRYDYSLVEYKDSKTKVKIICKHHGVFEQTPHNHLRGSGCSVCFRTKVSTELFVEKANLVHKNKYDYSKTNYVRASDKVIITCPIHGDFEQTPSHHLTGHECRKCGYDKVVSQTSYTTDEFIEKANKKHNNRYDYSKTKYINTNTKVCITCREHGDFWQVASYHLSGNGCQKCNYSKGELLIYNWLKENKIPFKPQFELVTDKIARNSNLILIDFFVKFNNKQYFIEYDGIQHFEYVEYLHKGGIIDFEKQQRRDKVLNDFCELYKDKVTLIRFRYTQSENEIINILNKKFFENTNCNI